MVSVGNFKLTADDPKFPIPADSTKASTLWLICNNTLADAAAGVKAATQQHVRVQVTNAGGTVVSDKQYVVGSSAKTGTGASAQVDLPKGSNLATIIPGTGGPCDQRIGFYLA